MRASHRSLCVLCTLITAFTVSPAAHGEEPPTEVGGIVGIVFPAAVSPSKEIYELIRGGIKDELRKHRLAVSEQAIDSERPSFDVKRWVQELHARGVVSLGRAGYTSVEELRGSVPVVAGAVQSDDASFRNADARVTTLSLTADPRYLLEGLHQVAPHIRRVLVAYNSDRQSTLIEAARTEGERLHLSIAAFPARDLREASAHYWNILKYANPETDALWLLEGDDLVDVDGTLPSIIQSAWGRRFIVVSNVAEHARRGVLLATYPDANAVGHRLGSLLLEASQGEKPRTLFGTDVAYVVNARAASHLGIDTNLIARSRRAVIVGDL